MTEGSAQGAPIWSRSEGYARWYASRLGRAYKQNIVEVLRPWVHALTPQLVLDAGCGPILTFVDVLDQRTSVVAVDCSHEMARSAQARLRSLSRSGMAVCASIERLPFSAGRFEFVLSLNCLEFVPDYKKALAELHRVAAPGATAIIGVLNRSGTWEWTRRLRRPFTNAPYYRGRFLTERELAAGLSDAGWILDELRHSVRFPPLSLGEVGYRWFERWLPDERCGVLLVLCRRG